jgi:hypothetical protein
MHTAQHPSASRRASLLACCQVAGEGVPGRTVKRVAGPVVASRRARIGVSHRVLQVPQASATVEVQRRERVPHRVRPKMAHQVGRQSGRGSKAPDQAPHVRGKQPPARRRSEQRPPRPRGSCAARKHGEPRQVGSVGQVGIQTFGSRRRLAPFGRVRGRLRRRCEIVGPMPSSQASAEEPKPKAQPDRPAPQPRPPVKIPYDPDKVTKGDPRPGVEKRGKARAQP